MFLTHTAQCVLHITYSIISNPIFSAITVNFFLLYYYIFFLRVTPAICRQRISFYQLLFPVTCKIYHLYHKENKKYPKTAKCFRIFLFFHILPKGIPPPAKSSNINIKELIANLRFKNNRFGIGKIAACHNIE